MTSRSLTCIALIGVIVLLLTATPIAGVLAWEPAEEGNVKVVKKWGVTTGTVFEPDTRFVSPVSQSISLLLMRPQSYMMLSLTSESDRRSDDAITALSKDGLRTGIDVTVRYRIDTRQAAEFYRNYRTLATAEERLTRPSVRSALRTEAGRLPVTVVYTGESQAQLKAAVERKLAEEFADDGLILGAVQARNAELPAEYAQVVEQKETIEQRRQRKQDELTVEELEAERRCIKARGQADVNRILVESLSDEALAQKCIGELDEMDTVYIPIGDGGYPQFIRSPDSDGSSSSGSPVGPSSDITSVSSRSSTPFGSENETSN